MKGQLNLTFKDGMVSGSAVEGAELSEAAKMLLEAIKNPDIKVSLETVAGFRFYDTNLKQMVFFPGGAFRGNFSYNGKITATNIISPKVMEGYDTVLNTPKGTSILHEALEAYIGAKFFPGASAAIGTSVATAKNEAYNFSHKKAANIDPNYKEVDNKIFDVTHSRERINGAIVSEILILKNKVTGNIYYIGQ